MGYTTLRLMRERVAASAPPPDDTAHQPTAVEMRREIRELKARMAELETMLDGATAPEPEPVVLVQQATGTGKRRR